MTPLLAYVAVVVAIWILGALAICIVRLQERVDALEADNEKPLPGPPQAPVPPPGRRYEALAAAVSRYRSHRRK